MGSTSDPGGWAATKFGMTPEEVVAALGANSYVAAPEPEPQPFKLDETVDLPAAIAYAKDVIEKAKKGGEDTNVAIVDACKALLEEKRAATWGFSVKQREGSIEYDFRFIRRLKGTLEAIISWGAKGTGAYRRTLHVRSGTKVTQIPEIALDEKSKTQLRAIEDAIADVASAIQRACALRARPGPETIDADRVRAREVEVRGISLQPEFNFSGNRLARVSMSRKYAGEDYSNFDESGMQRTLCDALAEKYGPPDERNNNDSGYEVVWRFPTTVIRCISGQRSYTGRLFSRKWVAVIYEVPNAEREDSKDKL